MKRQTSTFFITFSISVLSLFLLSSRYKIDDKNSLEFAQSWKKIDSLEQKGLYRMALEEVHQVFDKATVKEAHNQVIKSVLYELKYNSYLEEDDYVLGIARLEGLIAKAPSPSKEILHSLLAEVYWGYYSGNIWKFSQRTSVVEVDLKDVRTWDLKRIAVKIRYHYGMSLLNASLSQEASIRDFSEIVSSASPTDYVSIRPTLFDFLGHRALNFFKSNTFSLPGPAETFVIDSPTYFYSTSSFLKMNSATHDSLNTRFLSVRVLHALTDFHTRKGNLEPLFYLELERLKYARIHSVLPEKEDLFYAGVERLANANKINSYASEAWYEMALFHSNEGNKYQHDGDTTARWEKKAAYDMCVNTKEKYPSAHGSQDCESLMSLITQKELKLSAGNVIAPNIDSKFLMDYKNIDGAHIKIVPFNFDKRNDDRYRGDKFFKELKKAEAVYEKTVQLTDPKDYNKHSVEQYIPKLESGFYYLVVSSDGSFDNHSGGYSFIPIWVSNITYQSRRMGGYSQVMVSDRTTGMPLIDARVHVTYQKYNYTLRRHDQKSVGNFKTDENGRFKFKIEKDYATYNLSIKHEGETYKPQTGVYGYRSGNYPGNSYVTHFFTDRKIYRPGQTIFFKGIMVDNQGKERLLLKDQSSEVVFYDVNSQEVERVKVKTNKFGSFEGQFTAPFGVLTGQMRISNGYGNTYFRVEEYKRPKFSIEMKAIEGEFEVNDSINATGFAEAFAGNKIDGADVKYRVVRSTQYNWNYWWGWRPFTEPKEVLNGKLITDENGEFNVVFKAVPDKESDPKTLPIFNYTVYVDVTDINGETHSTSTSIQVGYQSLQLGHNFTADMNNASDFFLRVNTTNLNGQKITAKGTVRVERLKMPKQPYYSRLWNNPDMKNWTKEEFKERYPLESYEDENNQYNWEVDKVAFERNFDTEISDSVAINNYKKWDPGVYRYVAVAIDKNGIEVKDVYYFTVFNPKSKKAPSNNVLWIKPLQTKAEPGETVTILLGSLESDLLVTYDTEANGELIETKSIKLTKEQRKLEFKIEEAYRGNFTVHFTALKNNRHFSQSFIITVPYTNKQLDLSFSTFRNKLLPGANEEWILTVKNKYGEKESAELLATLYDASLDELFTPNSFYMNIYKTFYGRHGWNSPGGMNMNNATNVNYEWNDHRSGAYRKFPNLKYFGWSSYYYGRAYGYYESYEDGIDMDESEVLDNLSAGNVSLRKNKDSKTAMAGANMDAPAPVLSGEMDISQKEQELESKNENGRLDDTKGGDASDTGLGNVKARANFNETAFFFPQLTTDANGDVKIKFTIPESLTKWRFLGLAHTDDLKIGTISEEVVTQKDLMVVPNAPRFLREGDVITIAAKISNISEEDLTGKAQLVLYDPFTEKEIGKAFDLSAAPKTFTAEKGKSTTVSWTINVPYTHSAVKYKIVAQAGNFSDGEENVLPILSNRMMVTESLPLPIRGKEDKTFNFEKLIKSDESKTLKHHRYTVEFTSNPAWYALQAMPYMMEYPHECAEQTFTRYYSNAIASHIMNSNPKIKTIIEKWGEDSPDAFLSNLQKNQELKAVMLEETPWVLDAKSEEASKRNLAVLLDMERMSRELDKALGKTIKTQSSNGGWPWFPGMQESRYITQHIVTGMGHLDHLGIKDIRNDARVWRMIKKAVEYLDGEIVRDYEYAKKYDVHYLTRQHIGYNQIQYLYARSYFPKIGMNKQTKEAVGYYKDQAELFWLQFNIYAEGMIGLAAHRFGIEGDDKAMTSLAQDIVKSLKDRSINTEEFGMYWKSYYVGYNWYEAPVETQALMIELFDEVADDQKVVEELKIWLLKEKQTTNWKTTKQTTEAVYALLLKGTDLLASDNMVEVTVGGKAIEYSNAPDENDPYQVKAQAGTGYFKTAWDADQVKSEMGNITLSKSDEGVAWGAAYWQYFEDLDEITFAETNLKLQKDLYLVEVTNDGEQLKPINDKNVLEVGQKVRVRVELRTDRNLEYVHMKDMRASGFEPIDVLSSYRYREGLGYYQSTKDAATHFFFDYIPKGVYVFEYDLRVQHKGDFSNGITTIQCMYAPEFTSHSNGIRVTVE